ncbi:MAG: hypothetical protein EXS52_02400 [Candidatus Staskawiczbacteria bacterium]|nr:hypothetical protein [Candidatus Staskawiczbacteria bacterium]
MASKSKISVWEKEGNYRSLQTNPEENNDFSPPGTVFSVTGEIRDGLDGVDDFMELNKKARAEARERGIKHVEGLDF